MVAIPGFLKFDHFLWSTRDRREPTKPLARKQDHQHRAPANNCRDPCHRHAVFSKQVARQVGSRAEELSGLMRRAEAPQ